MKYRKKPVTPEVIEVFQLDGNCSIDEEWFRDAIANNMITMHAEAWEYPWCEIHSPGVTEVAERWDYILKDALGNIRPCQKEVFEQMYEKVEDEVDEV